MPITPCGLMIEEDAENYAATSTARNQHEISQDVTWDNSQVRTINR